MFRHTLFLKKFVSLLLIFFMSAYVMSACVGVLNELKPEDSKSPLLVLPPGTPAGSAEAGPQGTTLTSSDGQLSIFIPEGAMRDEQEFTITKYTPPTTFMPAGYMPTTPVYEITPGYRFEKDVTISLLLDGARIEGLNLQKNRSRGFSISATSESDDTEKFSGWAGHSSSVSGDKVVFTSRTFSIFGGGSPVPGNLPPTIMGATYQFKANCSYLPYRVRARVVEPDGDTMTVHLYTGPVGSGANMIPMNREGVTDWYSVDIPYESMSQTGIQIQIIAADQHGANSHRPSSGNVFNYPADSGNAAYINNFDRDGDNDGLLCAWEQDNGLDDANASDAVGVSDTDGDGIPDVADHTPNGETNPVIDALVLFPDQITMDIGETAVIGLSASFGGQPRFVAASYNVTGNALNGSPVGGVSGTVFQANHPGVANVSALIGGINANSTVTVRDSVGPGPITDLSAVAGSHTAVRLQWTAPGNDLNFGNAAVYGVHLSTSAIADTAACQGATLLAHALIPKTAGQTETLDLNGLSPSTTYYFCVLAADGAGNFNTWSGSVSATTAAVPDLTPPANIAGLSTTVIGPSQIRLNWDASGDDGLTGAAAAYEIRRANTPINNDAQCDAGVNVVNSVTPVSAGTAMFFIVGGLSDNTIYYFCIRAFDDVNNRSVWSGVLTGTTPRGNLPPTADAGLDQNIILGATANLDASSSADADAAGCVAVTGNYVYSWSLVSKPLSSTLNTSSIVGRTTLAAQITPDLAGTYTLQFDFTDDPGLCAGGASLTTDTMVITATAIPSDMVQVSGGTYTRGKSGYTCCALTPHQVTLSTFLVDRYEVTASQYEACVNAGGCTYTGDTSYWQRTYQNGKPNHPINFVTWSDANAYCAWAGKKLPTEAQWEYAARGSDGRNFPWGNTHNCTYGNYDASDGMGSSCVNGTSAVGSYPTGVSPFGVYDMGGNVSEWVSDWYGDYGSAPLTDPTGPGSGPGKPARGGEHRYGPFVLNSWQRNAYAPGVRGAGIGFRCAK